MPTHTRPRTSQRSQRRARGSSRVLAGIAVAAILFGLAWASDYSTRPGVAALAAPSTWPDGLPFARRTERWTLLLFIHPRCACSFATLAELDRLLAGAAECLDAVVVAAPDPALGSSSRSVLARAATLPGLRVVHDPDGRIARRCDSHTSGQALLYAPDGRLRFAGGVTAGRGHEGANPGVDAIRAALRGEPGATRYSVFGCGLASRARRRGPDR